MQYPFNRNNPSLFNIPEWLWNPAYKGERNYHLWSVHTWVRNNPWLPAYHVWLNYKFEPDPRGDMRAVIKNFLGWSSKIEIYCQGVKLEGIELKNAKSEIICRLKKSLGKTTLKGVKITRYRFNLVAAFTEIDLVDKESHHESRDNAEMRKICAANGMQVRDEWLRATDDRVCNVYPMKKLEHRLTHYALGDSEFFHFAINKSPISKPNEMCAEGVDIKDINISNGKWVNNWNARIPAIPNKQLLAELWQLYLQLECGKYPYGNLDNLVTQT